NLHAHRLSGLLEQSAQRGRIDRGARGAVDRDDEVPYLEARVGRRRVRIHEPHLVAVTPADRRGSEHVDFEWSLEIRARLERDPKVPVVERDGAAPQYSTADVPC